MIGSIEPSRLALRSAMRHDLPARLRVRHPDRDMHAEAARPQDRRIDQVDAIGGAEHDHARELLDAVELGPKAGLPRGRWSSSRHAGRALVLWRRAGRRRSGWRDLARDAENLPQPSSDSPSHLVKISGPSTEMKLTPHSFAMALASSVLPVPEGPCSSAPTCGGRPLAVSTCGLRSGSSTVSCRRA